MRDRRRYERVAFFCPLRLSVLPDGRTVPGYSFDISIGGVGLMADITLERGEIVEICFLLKNHRNEDTTESLTGRVAYSCADEDGDRIGIEFLEPIRVSAHTLLARTINNL
jgi:hypothetical protein